MFLAPSAYITGENKKLAGYTYITHVLNSTDTTILYLHIGSNENLSSERVLQLQQTWAINKIKLKRGKGSFSY